MIVGGRCNQAPGVRLAIPAALAVVTLIGFLFPAPTNAQSLAEVARREADRREKVGETSKVYTDHSLKPAPPEAPRATPVSVTPELPAAKATEKPQEAASKAADLAAASHFDDRDEAFWRHRATTVRSALEAARADLAALDTRFDSLSGAKGGAETRERDVVTAGQKRARANISSLEGEWGRLEKAAQDAKVPITWIR